MNTSVNATETKEAHNPYALQRTAPCGTAPRFHRRLSTRHAGAAPHSAVAELGVVGRRYAYSNMTNQKAGICSFRRRLVLAIRDDMLRVINDPSSEACLRNIPVAELGPIADLSETQRTALKKMFAGIIDRGIMHFLYGLDNDASGFEIRFNDELLNDDGLLALSDLNIPLADESEFDRDGNRKSI